MLGCGLIDFVKFWQTCRFLTNLLHGLLCDSNRVSNLLLVTRQPKVEDTLIACFLGIFVDATQPITSGVSLQRIDGGEGLLPNAVSDRQSTHPTQPRLDATVYLAATTISDLFSDYRQRERQGRQTGTEQTGATTGASIYDAPDGPKDATEM